MSFDSTYGMIDHDGTFLKDEAVTLEERKEDILEEKENVIYYGNRRHKVYHDKDCYCVREITPSNLIGLDETCVDDNGRLYRACGHCLGKSFNQMVKDLVDMRGDD